MILRKHLSAAAFAVTALTVVVRAPSAQAAKGNVRTVAQDNSDNINPAGFFALVETEVPPIANKYLEDKGLSFFKGPFKSRWEGSQNVRGAYEARFKSGEIEQILGSNEAQARAGRVFFCFFTNKDKFKTIEELAKQDANVRSALSSFVESLHTATLSSGDFTGPATTAAEKLNGVINGRAPAIPAFEESSDMFALALIDITKKAFTKANLDKTASIGVVPTAPRYEVASSF